MNIFHVGLKDRWNKLTIYQQMANIGAEVGRATSWRNKNYKLSKNAFYRALELLDFTIADPKNKNSLKEIVRVRELLADFFTGENIYNSTYQSWEKYFYYFNFAVRSTK